MLICPRARRRLTIRPFVLKTSTQVLSRHGFMIQAIFFDFNGVIINDEPLHLKAYQETLAGKGIELTEETYMTMLGMDDLTFVRANFERAGKSLTDEMAKAIMAREWELHRQALE